MTLLLKILRTIIIHQLLPLPIISAENINTCWTRENNEFFILSWRLLKRVSSIILIMLPLPIYSTILLLTRIHQGRKNITRDEYNTSSMNLNKSWYYPTHKAFEALGGFWHTCRAPFLCNHQACQLSSHWYLSEEGTLQL